LEAKTTAADSIPTIRVNQASETFNIEFRDQAGQVLRLEATDEVTVEVSAGLELGLEPGERFLLTARAGPSGSVRIVATSSDGRIRFRSAAIPVGIADQPGIVPGGRSCRLRHLGPSPRATERV